jgi:ligand-binding sensor domain-containing protein/signal transduction histidine kinase
LARFDGIRFATLEELAELNVQCVYALLEDHQRGLWIATEGGVFRFFNGKVSHLVQADGLLDNRVFGLCEAQDGSIWMGTAGGVSQWHEGQFRNFTVKDGLPHSVVRAISIDSEGAVWAATAAGLVRIKDGKLSVPEMSADWAKAVRFVYVDQKDTVWVGTYMGLCRKTEKGWELFDKEHFPLADKFVNTLFSDHGGRLWIGTHGGLNWMENGIFHTELTSEGAAYDLVNAIYEDREGNIWIGSKEGLSRLKLRPFTAVTKQQGLNYNNVMSVIEEKRGTFLCATWGAGLFRFQGKGTDISALTNYFPAYRMLSLCEARDGSLWCGTDHGAGLFRLQGGKETHFDESHGLDKIGIPVIYEDRKTNLWIGTSRSLALFRGDKFIHFTSRDGLAGDGVKVICEDEEDNLWIGTTGGLSCRKNGVFTKLTTANGLSHNVVLALYCDKQNDLWIGTAGGGLNRLRNGNFTVYTTHHGLFNNEILEIQEDDAGDLWMTSLNGIFRVHKNDFNRLDRKEISSIPCASYGKDDGMTSIICCNVAKPASWKARDGRLWFATTKGIVIADPAMKANGTPPPVVIEDILVDKKKIAKEKDSLVIPPGRGEVEIHFSALSFAAPEKNRFKYKLDGIDSDWRDVGNRRFAYYNNLRPGRYRFEVMASNNDGVWNSLKAPLELMFQPHWWQTWSFRTFVTLLSLSVASLGARYVTKRRMQMKLKSLEHQHSIEKERSRIARDMHDDLGACLTQILFLSDVARKNKCSPDIVDHQINRISETTQEVVRNLDGIVWAVNPKNDTLEGLAAYIEEYVGMFLNGSAIRCRFDFPEQLPSVALSSDLRHNLFLVVKEALNNAVKYSGASEIRLELKHSARALSLAVEDNGKGFTTSEATTLGNGLRNMEERVRGLGGCLEIKSQRGRGTRIQLQIPLPAISPDFSGDS